MSGMRMSGKGQDALRQFAQQTRGLSLLRPSESILIVCTVYWRAVSATQGTVALRRAVVMPLRGMW